MEVKIEKLIDWDKVKKVALNTIGKKYTGKEISEYWKEKIIKSEHSPIRCLTYEIEMIGIPYFVSVHLTRHKIGVEHFVTTQRTDRTGEIREDKRQDALVNHIMIINAQSIITISRKRLCRLADVKTREVWKMVITELEKIEPALSKNCLQDCEYRGGCKEMKPCLKI